MQIETRHIDDKLYVRCLVRRRWVVLTPEEDVRQHILGQLIHGKGYPVGLIQVEKEIRLHGLRRRPDIVAWSRDMQPILVVECKAPNVPLTAAVLEQAVRYNRELKVRCLFISNGGTYHCVVYEGDSVTTRNELPTYQELAAEVGGKDEIEGSTESGGI